MARHIKQKTTQSSKVSKPNQIRETNNPEADIRNNDLRKYIKHKTRDLPQPQSPNNYNDINNHKPKREYQMKITDTRLIFHIPKEKLGIFDYTPEDPDSFIRKLQGIEKKQQSKSREVKRKTKRIKKRGEKIVRRLEYYLLKQGTKIESPVPTQKSIQDIEWLQIENSVDSSNWKKENQT